MTGVRCKVAIIAIIVVTAVAAAVAAMVVAAHRTAHVVKHAVIAAEAASICMIGIMIEIRIVGVGSEHHRMGA